MEQRGQDWMLFTNPLYLFAILPLSCLVFYALTPKFGKLFGLGFLTLASLLIYAPWGMDYLALLIASIGVNFLSAYLLLTLRDDAPYRKTAFWLGLAYNFGTLIWFKYLWALRQLAGQQFSLVNIAIPAGISFYTFQQAIVLIDSYYRDPCVVAYLGNLRAPWGKLCGLVRHAFFVSFFPHLLIGPIVYLQEFQPQVAKPAFGKFNPRNLEVGLTLIAIGLFKKLVLADNLAPIADTAFTAAQTHLPLSESAAWAGALAYYAQLYFDFSGYSDMAIGSARALGIRFPINFYSPLKAVGIMDYYRRWHMTLTRAISRFFFLPLSVSFARFATRLQLTGTFARILMLWIPLLINFEAIALWHGARLTFVLFGIVHGCWYVTESEVRKTGLWKKWKLATPDETRGLLGRLFFTVAMVFCFTLFRAPDISSFGYFVTHMIHSPNADPRGPFFLSMRQALYLVHLRRYARAAAILQRWDVPLILAAYGVLWLMPNSMEILRRYRPGIPTYKNSRYGFNWRFFDWRPDWRWAAAMGAILLCSIYYFGRQPFFLYLGF